VLFLIDEGRRHVEAERQRSIQNNSGLLSNPDSASNMAALAETQIAASAAGMVLTPVEVRAVDDFDPAFAAMMRERADAILVSNDPFHQLHIGRIACCSAVMPMPLSATASSTQSRRSATLRTRRATSPSFVNLQALLRRLSRICLSTRKELRKRH
jgi:hypothetical protein